MRSRWTVPLVFVALAAGPAQTGTAVLSGTLLTNTEVPQPVRRAVVRLAGAAGTSARLAGTDDQGRFVFPSLPAGSFVLSATKPGFVPAFHGSTRPGRGPGVPIAIADGQRVDVTFRMLPGAAITGTITDSRGNPMASVAVVAVDARAGANAPASLRATTDDRGVYRIFGLAPGDYLVSAVPRFGTGRGAFPTNVPGVTDAEIEWARGFGAAPRAGAGAAGSTLTPPPGQPVTYAPVYYPGTTDAGAAQRVTLAAGEERINVGFPFPVVTTARIAGTFVDDSGPIVATVSVFLLPRGSASSSSSATEALIAAGALVLPRAGVSAPEFLFPSVTPGEYTLVARTGGYGRMLAATSAPTLWNLTELTVDGRDHSDLVLRLEPGMEVTGSIALDGSSGPAPIDVSGFEVSLVDANGLMGAPSPKAVVDPAGTFRFPRVAPGSYALKATQPSAQTGARWILKSAMLGGRDVADLLVDVKPGQNITGLAITFTDRESEISGRLVDATGNPVTRYSIVVFTVDRSLWLPNARRVRLGNPAADGSFSIAGLPAGEYAIAAAEAVEAADLADPMFLSQLLEGSYRLTLAEGEKKTQNLRIGGGGTQ